MPEQNTNDSRPPLNIVTEGGATNSRPPLKIIGGDDTPQKKNPVQNTTASGAGSDATLADADMQSLQGGAQQNQTGTLNDKPLDEYGNPNDLQKLVDEKTQGKDVRSYVWGKHTQMINDKIDLDKNNLQLREFPKQPKFQEYQQLKAQLQQLNPDTPQYSAIDKQMKDLAAQPLVQPSSNLQYSWGDNAPEQALAVGGGKMGTTHTKMPESVNYFKDINTVGDFVKKYDELYSKSTQLQQRSQQNQDDLNTVIDSQRKLKGFQGDKDGVKELNALQSFGSGIYQTLDHAVSGAKYLISDDDTRNEMLKRQLGEQVLYPERPSEKYSLLGTSPAQVTGMIGGLVPYLIPGASLEAMGASALTKTVGGGLVDATMFGLTNGYTNALSAYSDALDKTRDENKALLAANDVFKKSGAVGAATGAVLPLFGRAGAALGGKVIGEDLAAEVEVNGTKNLGLTDYLKYNLSKHAVSALPFPIQTYLDNKISQENGGDRDAMSGVVQSYLAAGVTGSMLDHMAYGWHNIPATTKDVYLNAMAKFMPNQVTEALDKGIQNETINPQVAQNIKDEITERSAAMAQIPQDISPEKQSAVLPLVIEKQKLIAEQGENKTLPDEHFTNKLESLDKKINETLGTPLTNDEQLTLETLRQREKEKGDDGKIKKPLTDTETDLKNHLEARENGAKNTRPDEVDNATSTDKKVPEEAEKDATNNEQVNSADKAEPVKVGSAQFSEHGEDKLTADDKENGTGNSKLTDTGKQEASKQGEDIAKAQPNLETIYTSDVNRSKETGDIAAESAGNVLGKDVEVKEQPLLATWNIGDAEGDKDGSFDEKKWADKPDEVPPGGESWNSFAERSKKAWEWAKTLGNNAHGITHSKVTRMFDALNESGGDMAKAKELFFKSLDAENAAKENVGKSDDIDDATKGNIEGSESESNAGSKNAISNEVRERLGLKPLDLPKLENRNERLQKAKDLVDGGEVNPMDVVQNLLNHKADIENAKTSIRDESILQYFNLQLSTRQRELNVEKLDVQDKLDTDPTNEDFQSQKAIINNNLLNNYDLIDKQLEAAQIGGRVWHGIGDTRQTEINQKGQIVNSINRIKTAYDGNVPDAVKQELNDLREKYDALTAKTDKLEAKLKKEQAKREVDNAIKEASKKKISKKLLATQKEQAINNIKDKVGKLTAKIAEKAGGKVNFVDDDEDTKELLSSISSDIGTLLSVYAKQGILTLDEMINKIHGDISGLTNITKENVRDIIAGKYSDKKSLSDLQKSVNSIRQEARTRAKIESLEKGILQETTKKAEKSERAIKLQKELAYAKKEALNEYPNLSTEELKNKAESIQRQIDRGEFAKTPFERKPFEKDPEWLAANKAKNDIRAKLRKLEADALDSKKTRTMRAMDVAQQWSKRSLFLMSQAYQLKMASTTLGALITKPANELLGAGFTKAFPYIGRNAPIEGGSANLQSIVKFYTEYLNPIKLYKGTRDIIDIQGRTGGETELEKENETSPKESHIRGVDLLTTDPHRIIKDPLKRAAYESAMIKQLDWYQNAELNPNDHALLESAKAAAYLKGKSEIFMSSGEDEATKAKQNGIIRAIKKDFAAIEGKAIDKGDNASYGGAQIWNFLNPIVGVPTNILGVVSRGNPVSFAKNLGSAFFQNRDVANGIKSLTQNESDLIIRNLKQGAIGTAFYLMGAFAVGAKAGGLYTRFNNKEDNQDANKLNIDGFDVPKNAQHSTQIQSYQVGATWAIVYNHYSKDKGQSNTLAAAMATAATLGNYADMEPIVSETGKLYDAVKTPQGLKKFGDDLQRRIGVDKAHKIMVKVGLLDETSTLK